MFYYLHTFGCQMNKSDSERIESLLQQQGWQTAETPEQAKLIIFNTCSVRQTAEDRVYGLLSNYAEYRQTNKTDLRLVVTGCLAGRDKAGKIKQKLKMVDLFFPIEEIVYLPQRLQSFWPHLALKNESAHYLTILPQYTSPVQAFVPIMTGCNNFCSYCVVPYARGREQSRPLQEILREVQSLAQRGYQEITLLGQNVNSYAPTHPSYSRTNPYQHPFAALLWEINQIPGLIRVGFTSSHPKDMTDEVIDALTLPKMLNYLHLALQSGSTRILKAMNRHYTAPDYLKLIKKIRKKKPTIALGTDLIVGFPGETETDFAKTVQLYEKIRFDIAYPAQFSPRPGTAAAQLPKTVPTAEKKRRWQIIQDLMEKITYELNQQYVGQTVEVLVDHYKKGLAAGWSREQKLVHFPGTEELVHQTCLVKIHTAKTWLLEGIRAT